MKEVSRESSTASRPGTNMASTDAVLLPTVQVSPRGSPRCATRTFVHRRKGGRAYGRWVRMRRIAVAISMLAATGLSPAAAHAYVGAPITHGPDPALVGKGPETAAAPGSLGKRVAKLVPSAWCGTEASTDDTVNEVDNGAYRYHAVYMIAADGRDRFSSVATTLQNDAFQASALLEKSY